MKTPREILFERHRDVELKLDTMRRKVIGELTESPGLVAVPSKPHGSIGILGKVWLELIWPARRAWVGMAAVWLAILLANVELKAGSPRAHTARSMSVNQLAQAIKEQRRLLAELLPTAKPEPRPASNPNAQPRSERVPRFKSC